jgi:hypothetical protein
VSATIDVPVGAPFWTVDEGRAAARRLHRICNSATSCLSVFLNIGNPMIEWMKVAERKGSGRWEGLVVLEEGWAEEVTHVVDLV